MISKKLAKALNEQMVFEMYSSYIYLALAAALEKNKMPGAVHWMRMQADEELIHANIFFNYLTDQNAEIELDAIPKPAISAKTPLEIFQAALGHEREGRQTRRRGHAGKGEFPGRTSGASEGGCRYRRLRQSCDFPPGFSRRLPPGFSQGADSASGTARQPALSGTHGTVERSLSGRPPVRSESFFSVAFCGKTVADGGADLVASRS